MALTLSGSTQASTLGPLGFSYDIIRQIYIGKVHFRPLLETLGMSEHHIKLVIECWYGTQPTPTNFEVQTLGNHMFLAKEKHGQAWVEGQLEGGMSDSFDRDAEIRKFWEGLMLTNQRERWG